MKFLIGETRKLMAISAIRVAPELKLKLKLQLPTETTNYQLFNFQLFPSAQLLAELPRQLCMPSQWRVLFVGLGDSR
jgi:hypothetical protein